MQNAGVNIYENYFESCADSANVLQCYHPNPELLVRPDIFRTNKTTIVQNINFSVQQLKFLFRVKKFLKLL